MAVSPVSFRASSSQQGLMSQQISPAAEIRLQEFCSKTGIKILQENGQRKYGGPPENWCGSPPSRGTEVFVGKLPRDLYEDELIPQFSKVGKIYELRLMMDFSGSNRGYCFVTFANKDDAKGKACEQLNNYEIRPGKHIGVMMSVDNCRLFVGGIPRDRKKEEIKVEMEKLTDGVVDVILYPSANDKAKNRGFAFVEYVSHKAAAMARRNLVPKHVQLWGQPICVDWAEPEQDVDDETMANVKILYVRNLMLDTAEETIKKLFEDIKPGSVERVKKLKDYAFVHFHEREDAHDAMQKTNGQTLEGAVLEVVWAKPPDKSIMRYVKNVQKLGSQALPPGPNVHSSIVAAATAQMYAASTGQGQQTGFLTPSGASSPPSPSVIGDPLSWAYTGHSIVDPGYSPYQLTPPSERISHIRSVGTTANRLTRGAAGMRAAGFQSFMTNQVRKTRRRHCDAALVYELSPLNGAVPFPVTPILPTHPGMVLVPTASLVPNGAHLAAAAPISTMPVVSQATHHHTAPIQPSVTTPGATSPLGTVPKVYSEELQELCCKYDWGTPDFQLSTFVTKDVYGRDVSAYVCKVTIPALVPSFGSFSPQRYWLEPDIAKEFAALHALTQVGAHPVEAPAAPEISVHQPVFSALPQNAY